MANGKEDDAMRRRINDQLEDSGSTFDNEENAYRSRRGLRSQLATPWIKDKTDRSDPAVRRDLERGDMDYGPEGKPPQVPMGSYRKGGMVKYGSPKHTAPCRDTKTIKCTS